MIDLLNIPEELRALSQWVCWRTEVRDGKATKVPIDARNGGRLASSTDLRTWATFAEARNFLDSCPDLARGVGFVFSKDDPYCGVDLDDCIDPATGEIDADAAATIVRFGTYYEKSPSGTGVHLILRGTPPGELGKKRGDRECYSQGRYFTMTGDCFGQPVGVADAQAELDAWHAETFPTPAAVEHKSSTAKLYLFGVADYDVIDKIAESKQGDKFSRLWAGNTTGYASGSEADLALCGMLTWWTNHDLAAVDRLFRASGLMRPKWDAKRGEQTYGARTIARAHEGTQGGYSPDYKSAEPEALMHTTQQPANTPVVPDGRIFYWMSELQRFEANEKWIWNGFISRGGITLLSALWKAGKSTLLAHLLKSFEAEGQFLGRDIKPSRILYVSEEDQGTWAERREALRIGDHVGMICRQFKGRASPADWKKFLDAVITTVQTYQFDLVVFDTISKIWPVRDENNANQVEEALMPLWTVTAAGVAVLIVHHTRKSQGENFTAARGSGGLSAFCETLIDFDYGPDGRKSARRMLTSGGRYQETPRKWQIELTTGGQYVHVGDEEEAEEAEQEAERIGELRERVLSLLPTDPDDGMSLNAIAEAMKAAGWKWVGYHGRKPFMTKLLGLGALKGDAGYYRNSLHSPGDTESFSFSSNGNCLSETETETPLVPIGVEPVSV